MKSIKITSVSLLPELSTSLSKPRIKTIFIHEPSREQTLQNYLSREGTHQEHRANVSHAWGNWLKENCEKHNIPVIEARPWDTVMERVISKVK
jgi:hypothetical protein